MLSLTSRVSWAYYVVKILFNSHLNHSWTASHGAHSPGTPTSGVRQGCMLAPGLFCCADWCREWSQAEISEYTLVRTLLMTWTTLKTARCFLPREHQLQLSRRGSTKRLGTYVSIYHRRRPRSKTTTAMWTSHRSPSAQTPSNRSANLSTLAARSLVMNTACLESALHHLKRDVGGMRLWKSWYLTMDKDRWREFAIRAFAAQAPEKDIEIARHSASKMALTYVLFYCTVFAFIQYYWIV